MGIIVNVTQCNQGNVAAHYATGTALAKAGVIPGHDMTVEAAFTKLSYVCAMTNKNTKQKRKLIKSPMCGEFTIPVRPSERRFSWKKSLSLDTLAAIDTAARKTRSRKQTRSEYPYRRWRERVSRSVSPLPTAKSRSPSAASVGSRSGSDLSVAAAGEPLLQDRAIRAATTRSRSNSPVRQVT